MGFFGFDDPRGKQQLLGDRPTDLIGQGPGAVDPAISGREEAKAAVLAAHSHVERGSEHSRSAIGETVDHADRRLGTGGDFIAPTPAARVQFLLRIPTVVLALLVDIAPGGKGALTG